MDRAAPRLGFGMYSCGEAWRAARAGRPDAPFHDPLSFLAHAASLGAAGVQVELGVRDDAYLARLRAHAGDHGLYLEGQADAPADDGGLERFEAEVRCARAAGAAVMRLAFGGRRYESFGAAEDFRRFAAQARRSLALMEPVLRRHGVRLAVENHKDWLVEELLALLRRLDSEWVGVCVDTGNSLALLEEPYAVLEALAPWAVSTHLKDMAVAPHPAGFQLAEVPLGRGFLDLPRVVATLRRAAPGVRFNLEMITRDPLVVPCLEPGYWATLGGVRAARLAHALALARRHAPPAPLPGVAGLSPSERLALEEQNNRESLAHARACLGL